MHTRTWLTDRIPARVNISKVRRDINPNHDNTNIRWRDRFPATGHRKVLGAEGSAPPSCGWRLHSIAMWQSTRRRDGVPQPLCATTYGRGTCSPPLCTMAHGGGTGF